MAPIRFTVNGAGVEVTDLHPTTTLLQYLRVHRRLTGTKEGCAEGDCGACTVAVGEWLDGRLRWRAVNACILFLSTLHGKAVLTVEGLSSESQPLHPVQQAFVDHHAAQCGFCTPGFVMALVAHRLDPENGGHLATEDVIAGNLCRCTGYRPILDAAADAEPGGLEPAPPPELPDEAMPDYRAAGGRIRMPRSGDELAACLQETPDATLLAGGTDIGLWVTKALRELDDLVWLGACADLQRIDATPDGLRIGAAVRLHDAHPALAGHWPELGELLRRFACVQIRQAGTVLGNVLNASPIGDGSPAFLALGASLVLRKGDRRRTVPLDSFFLAYRKTALEQGEFAEALLLPWPTDGQVFKAMKLSKRFDQDISAVMGAFRLTLADGLVQDARLAFGGLAAIPRRSPSAEAALVGQRLDEAAIEAACAGFRQDFQPIDDVRATAAYRLEAGQNLLRRLFYEVTSPADAPRILDLEITA
ncbi:MAG TPA: xanthine dehydrogenase small subunit [Geminicoccus sp.]|uniref:xanthine dehydrogenase small subunit n=1 Tax=Geminicoccus sp. TaxID=2024832 RepID=UPI002D1DAC01|nr:xanthine dehydrogenase small subunit [Geminicoccus sp.]HWL69640.1 xanthine dehydrogenase small subunit [Geminicoccus sp.]